MPASAVSGWSSRSGDSSMKISFSMTCTGESECIDKIDTIEGLVKIKIKGEAKMSDGQIKFGFSFSLTKCGPTKGRALKVNVASEDLEYSISGVNVPDEWSQWYLMGWEEPFKTQNSKMYSTLLAIIVTVIEDENETLFTKLYTDTEFNDFHLTTVGGSVPIHKACLAIHSDVFRAMLHREWKETKEGKINMKGVTIKTLQHLKDYMYLGTVPDDGLRQLLLIAKQYLIEDLEKQCIRKLAETVSSKELFSLVQFACDYNIPELACALIVLTQDSVVTGAHEMKKKEKLKKLSRHGKKK